MALDKKIHISPLLIPIKIHYFLYFAAIAYVLPLRSVYVQQLGISSSEIGIMFGVISVTRLLFNPLVGAFLDKFKMFRLTICLAVAFVAISHQAMLFIPVNPPPSHHNYSLETQLELLCNGSQTSYQFLHAHSKPQHIHNRTLICNITCRDEKNKYNFSYTSIESFSEDGSLNFKAPSFDICNESDDGNRIDLQCFSEMCKVDKVSSHQMFSSQFWMFLFLMIMSSAAVTAVSCLMDAVCYEVLDNKPEQYGSQRLYGSVGWAVGALAGGYLNQLLGKDTADIIDYSPCFYLLTALCIVDFIPLYFIKVENVKFSPNICIDVKKFLYDSAVVGYMVMAFWIGILAGLIWNYSFLFMNEIGSSQLLMGLSQFVECALAEAPAFLVSGWVLKKCGHVNVITVTLFLFSVRYSCTIFMYNPWWTLPVCLIQGITYGLYYASLTSFAKTNAKPGTEATAQSILTVIFESVGVATGSVLGGVGFEALGSRTTFAWSAGVGFSLMGINLLVQYFYRRKKMRETTKENGIVAAHSYKIRS